jgi:hypothetical protein
LSANSAAGIYFGKNDIMRKTSKLCSSGSVLRSKRFAVAAPRRVEIDQHILVAANNLIKVLREKMSFRFSYSKTAF